MDPTLLEINANISIKYRELTYWFDMAATFGALTLCLGWTFIVFIPTSVLQEPGHPIAISVLGVVIAVCGGISGVGARKSWRYMAEFLALRRQRKAHIASRSLPA